MAFVHAVARFTAVGLLGLVAPLVAPAASLAQDTPGTAPAQAAAGARAASALLLPDSTILFIRVEDSSQLREALRSSQLGQLIADPAMEPLKQDIEGKLAGLGKEVQAQVGLSIEELLTLPQGPMSLAVIPTPGQARPVAVYTVADAGQNVANMDQFMERATALAKEQGVTVQDETFLGLTLHVMTGQGDTPPVAWTKQGSLYHYATELSVLKDMLQHTEGRTENLAGTDSFRRIFEKAGREAQVVWYLDLAGAVSLGMSVMQDQDQGNAMVLENQLKLTGLDALKAIGGGLTFNVGPYDQLSRVFLYAPGEPRGLIPLFQMPQVDLSPQPWVPATAASYQSLSWDLDAAYQALKTFTDENFAQGMLEGIEQQIAGPQGQQIRFQQDIFGPLGNRITVVSDFERPGDDESQRVLFAVALDDPEAFGQTIEKVLAMVNAEPRKREFQGTTIYEFEIPELPNAAGANAPVLQGPLFLAIAQGHLFVANPASILEQVIRGGGQGLRETPAYQQAAVHFPETSSSQSFTRPEEQARALHNLVKSGRLNETIREAARNAGAPVPDEAFIDPAKIPDFSVFEKYISQSGGYGVMEAEGVTFTQFTLKKQAP